MTSKLLEREAVARGVSIDEMRKQLTFGEIHVTHAQVEDAYKQNASFFASMSPDEARERLRLDLENQARMKHYRTGLSSAKEVERQAELSATGVCDGVGRRSVAGERRDEAVGDHR